MENIFSTLISEFSNPIRIKILLLLVEKKARLSEITDIIGNTSNSEISRHIARLAKHNFIQKESVSGRYYEITPFGEAAIINFGSLQFLFQNGEFFKEHRITDLPFSAMKLIDSLNDAELIVGTGLVMTKMTQFIDLPSKKLFLMIDSPFPFDLSKFSVDFIIPHNLAKMRDKMENEPVVMRGRVLPQISIAIAISDTGHGMLSFPKIKDNHADFSCAFYISDPQGWEYLKSIWSYYWELAEDASQYH